MRALMQSPTGAQLVGIDTERLHPLMFGVGLGLSGVAGCLLSMTYTISPAMGEPYTVTALIVITLGGFGSMAGALVGGLAAGRDRGDRHALHQPVAEVAAVVRHLHRRAAVAAERPVRPAMNARPRSASCSCARRRLGAGAALRRQRVRRLAGADLPDVRGAGVELGLFCGSTRYLSLATAAFFGIGAYTGALALGAAAVAARRSRSAPAIAAAVAVVMGAAVLHLRGTYFAVLTFGMTELIRHAVTYFEKQVTGTVGRVLTVVPERDTVYLTVLALAVARGASLSIVVRRSRFGLALAGIGADEQRAQTLGVDTRLVKIAGFALTAAFAGAVGAAMSVRWTYIDPATVFNPFIGFQTVLIALIGGAATLWGPLIAAVVFSLLAETLRLQLPQVYMMSLGVLLILSRAVPAGRAGVAALAARTARWRQRRWSGACASRCSRRARVTVASAA